MSETRSSSEFNVRPDPPRITSRRFIKTVKQKKRFRSSVPVYVDVRSESNGRKESEWEKKGEGGESGVQ